MKFLTQSAILYSITPVNPSIQFIIWILTLWFLMPFLAPLVAIVQYILSWIWNAWILFIGTSRSNLRKIQNNSLWGGPWCGRFLKKKCQLLFHPCCQCGNAPYGWMYLLNLLCNWTFRWSRAVLRLLVLFHARITVCSCMNLLLFDRKGGETSNCLSFLALMYKNW